MQMAFILAANQVVSHGFGLFLFSALFPLMREPLGLSHWYLTTAGIATQVAYLTGALSVGFLSRKISAEKLVLATGAGAILLLLSLFFLSDPYQMIVVLFCLVFSAAVSWSAIVGLISRFASRESAATCLSVASSGTAWGYGINGLILLLWVPVFGWQSVWWLVAAVACVVWLVTLVMVRGLSRIEPSRNELTESDLVSLSMRQLLRACVTEERAFFSCLIYFLIGLICISFTSWLNTYLDELGSVESLAGTTWSVIGASGMACGLLVGRLADKKGHDVAMLLMAAGFSIGLTAFSFDPVRYAFLAGAGYGLLYFPAWGVVSSWLAVRYSPIATMQLSGIGMVASAIGGSLGNVIAGQILSDTGSLELLYSLLAVASGVLMLMTVWIYWLGRKAIAGHEEIQSIA